MSTVYRIEEYIPPKKGRRHVLRVVREILYFQPRHRGTDLGNALNFANEVAKRRAAKADARARRSTRVQ